MTKIPTTRPTNLNSDWYNLESLKYLHYLVLLEWIVPLSTLMSIFFVTIIGFF